MKTQRAISSKTKATRTFRRLFPLTLLSGFLFLPFTLAHVPAAPQTSQSTVAQTDAAHTRPLPNGIEIHCDKFVLQVVALRDDVLRIRESAKSELPEDASWAVPVEIRRQSIQVVPENAAGTVGFHTKALRARVELSTLSLSITDLVGNVVQEDASVWPPDFHQDAFRVYKKMPADEHYFGRGDKTGGVDRRAHSFRMWNTDAFLFQESTDPIYKSIPFF